MSPFKLFYKKPCHFPVELEHRAYWVVTQLNMDWKAAGNRRLLELNEIEEFRAQVYENAKIYNEKTKYWHNKRIMPQKFELGQHVLLFNSRLKLFPGKLKSRWSSPFEVAKVYPYGVVDVKDMHTGVTIKVNKKCLKQYGGAHVDGDNKSINL
ncbi:uncharacterized protein [Gossypium hirsutum]|uniref:Protein NYNRIN-like n=1 Tax=Gossypium hirsutum TaxID=3635 RepID=A0A1U8IDJ7_GOSHI|nr:uncharacterized protein LOC107895520 [Gossypium hirsutum]